MNKAMTRRGFCVMGAAAFLALGGCGSTEAQGGAPGTSESVDHEGGDAEPAGLVTAQSRGGAAAAADEPVKLSTFAFDTLVSLTAYGVDKDVVQRCLASCSEYEELFSARLEGSDIARINGAAGKPVEVDPRTAEVLERALEYGQMSKGLFDVTVGSVSLLWDFEEGVKPADRAIKEGVDHIDSAVLSVDGTTVTLADPDARIDLGGIAKGWIAGRLRDDLLAAGATGGIVNLGTSSTCLFGTKPDGSLWRIGLRDPRGGESGSLLGVVELTDCSVTSSGLYDRQFEQDGVVYWHILDPSTGYPVDTDMLGDTVVCEDPTLGDALSTTLFVMGIEQATAWLEEHMPEVCAMFVGEDDVPVFANDFEGRCHFEPVASRGAAS